MNKQDALKALNTKIKTLQAGIDADKPASLADLDMLIIIDELSEAFGHQTTENFDAWMFATFQLGLDMSGSMILHQKVDSASPHSDAVNAIMYLTALYATLQHK